MTAVPIVKAGESFDFSFDRGTETIVGWTCLIEVMQYPGGAAQVSRTITPTDSAWSGFLTATETAALTPIGMYRLIAQLTNSTTDEFESQPIRFNLTDAW